MGTALLVARLELRRRLRDRSAIVFAVIAPLVLASILGTAFSGLDDGGIHVDVALVDADGTATSATLREQVFASAALRESITVHPVSSADRARQDVQDERLPVAVVIPAGFEVALGGPGPVPDIELIARPGAPIASDFIRAVVDGWLSRVRAGRLAATTAASLGSAQPDAAALAGVATRAATMDPPLGLRNGGVEQDINLAAYFGPSMGILFLFLALGLMARSLLAERRDGTLARLQAAPVRLGQVLAGKAIAIGAAGVASLCLLWLVTSVVFGASWGSPLPVAALIVATVLAVGGIAAFISSMAKTEAQAEGFTSIAAFVLGLLGGNFFPINELPDGFLRISRLTPNGVALQAFSDLSFQRDGLGDIAGALATLVAIGVVTATIAGRRSQRGLA